MRCTLSQSLMKISKRPEREGGCNVGGKKKKKKNSAHDLLERQPKKNHWWLLISAVAANEMEVRGFQCQEVSAVASA